MVSVISIKGMEVVSQTLVISVSFIRSLNKIRVAVRLNELLGYIFAQHPTE